MATTLAANATEAQALAYLSANFKNTYSNTVSTPYQGKTGAQIYAILKTASPSSTPFQLAQAAGDLLLSSALGSTVGAAADTAGLVVGDAGTGIANASFIPSWSTGLTQLLSALTSGALWIRVAEGVLGVVLIAIGLAKITRAVPVATKIAKTAGAVAVL